MSEWRSRALHPARRVLRRPRSPRVRTEQSMDSRAPATTTAFPTVEDSIVDIALYRDRWRVASPPTVADAHRSLLAEQGTMAWIGLYRRSEAQLLAAAEAFGLHELAVENAIVAHRRPKLAVSSCLARRIVRP